ncbi:putative mitochondrial RNA binding protein [Trypanosoma rangeli]|uniref:Putative mitochondrial RNA binding protein n=1 Tax=Trypanosoma rangeli TaxID=5698 RepID=A0A3R7KJR2_TRYRA|nr:putative mitochondrial RNA binding protein [Trypanosoma rangeli]RNF07858.1 putative mitochondrial RNA binding protein [Trypanosoma rangeli]|eukprot:RNF07858.1 putative mitochondrial RNA binding protein [Trypanosoma rangeli]
MWRFVLVTRRFSAAPSVLHRCCTVAPSPASRQASASETTTASAPQPQETVLQSPSMPLFQLLAFVVEELLKNPPSAAVRDNMKTTKPAGLTAAAAAKDVGGVAVESPSLPGLSSVQLIRVISTYLRREEEMALLSRSKVAAVRQQYLKMRAKQPRLSPLQRDILLHEVARIVERREVPLAVAARLLRPRWPNYFMDVVGVRHHAFLVQSLRAWAVAVMQDNTLTPAEARIFLMRCPRLFVGQVSLMGSVVECALLDLKTLDDPELLIQLMWSVNSAKTHAPHHFWRRVVDKLSTLNRSLRDKVGDAICMEKDKGKKEDGKKATAAHSVVVGHVFSGLTTRQLFRVLRVLRREQWCGDVPLIFDFVDKALKNIVFEVEATHVAEDKPRGAPLSRRAVAQRLKQAADLSPAELLSLLSIAGELGVDLHVSLARLSEDLLSPMVRYLDRDQLLLLTTCVRQTRCDSPHLVQTIVDTIVRRGATYPCSLALTKAALRTILQKPALLARLTLVPFVDHIFHLCDTLKWHMRASQILAWVELLYAFSRLYAPSSSVGVRVRTMVDSFADPLNAMLELGVVPISIVSRVLEHTVILGMRKQPQYPRTAKLWENRNTLVNGRNAHAELQGGGDTDATALPDHDTAGDATSSVSDSEVFSSSVVTKSARKVYDDLISVYERQTVMRMPLSKKEEERIRDSFQRLGLYSIFMGANVMQKLHLRGPAAAASALASLHKTPPARPFSTWMEQQVASVIDTRIRSAKITPESTDNDVLRVLGRRQCDAGNVRCFQELVVNAPLQLARQQRSLWEYTAELARRFGGAQEQSFSQEMLRKALT